MIPNFPTFKPLELTDREEIIKLTSGFPPYSDFNFVSMWSWNVTGLMAISILNGNLIVKFNDYVTGEMFYSFIGSNQPNETAQALIELSIKEGLQPKLKLLPNEVATLLDTKKFIAVEEREHFDYVIDVERLLPHDGSERPLSSRRRLINKFKEMVPCEIRKIDIFDPSVQLQIMEVFSQWEQQVDKDEVNTEHVKRSLDRLFSMPNDSNILSFGAYIRNELAGYCINELLPNSYVVGHFQQGNLTTFSGIYALLMHETAPYFHNLGYKHVNLEQDLNIPGLRTWKLSHHPTSFLKKFEVYVVDK